MPSNFFLLFFTFCFSKIFCQDLTDNKITLSDWMSQTVDYSKTLKDICLPGAHDASIFQCFDCTVGANIKNTKTQKLPIQNLLDSGVRYFDLRPVLSGNQFFTGHYTKYTKRPSFGCKGDSLQRILTVVNHFLEKHRELVVLHFSHYCDRSWTKKNKTFLPLLLKLFEECLGKNIFVMLRDSTKNLSEINLCNLLDSKNGKVIILMDDYKGTSVTNKLQGIFSSTKDLTIFDKYSGTTKENYLVTDQKNKFCGWIKNKSDSRANIFLLSWTLTQDARAAKRCAGLKFPWQKCVSIFDVAQIVNLRLAQSMIDWKNESIISKINKPNIIVTDFTSGNQTRVCLWLNGL